MDRFSVIAAAIWQDVSWKEYAGMPANVRPVDVPDFFGSLWVNYTPPKEKFGYGWSIGDGVRWCSSDWS